jgi:hypothetical protein
MTAENELGVLLHVSVSDVVPHNDHAARALAARRRRRISRSVSAAAVCASLAAVALLASSVVRRGDSQSAASARWQRAVTLDGGRLRLAPPAVGDVAPVTRQEALAVLHRTNQGADVTIVASRWGRVTVTGQDGRAVDGFADRVAWTTVFRLRSDDHSCPGAPSAGSPVVEPGDFAQTQVLVVRADGAQVLYSQPGSWSCGLPVQPVAKIPEAAG